MHPQTIPVGETTILITALQFSVQKHLKEMKGAPAQTAFVRKPVSIAATLAKVGA